MDVKDIKGAIKDLDWKKLLVEKGEKIGLGVAAVCAVLMVIPFLWYLVAGNGPNANAKLLSDPAKALEDKQRASAPGPADLPPEGDVKVVIKDQKVTDHKPYQLALLTSGGAGTDRTKRSKPDIYPPEESVIVYAQPQIPRYVFDAKYQKIYVVKDEASRPSGTATEPTPGAPKKSSNPYGGGKGAGGYQPPMPGGPGFPGMGRPPGLGGGRPGPGGAGGDARGTSFTPIQPGGYQIPGSGDGFGDKKDLKFQLIDLTKWDYQMHSQEQILPLRLAEIDFSFPMGKQVDEHLRKLNLPDYGALRADTSGEVDENKNKLPSFRFLGVELERKTLDAAGNELTPWQEVKVKDAYKFYRFLNGRRYEDEPAKLEAVSPDGLVMPRLLAKSPDQYPQDIENQLPLLKKTLDAIDEKNKPVLPPSKNPLSEDDNFDPFKRAKDEGIDNRSSLRGGPGMLEPGMPGGPGKPGFTPPPQVPPSKPNKPGGPPGSGPAGVSPKPPPPGAPGLGDERSGRGGPGTPGVLPTEADSTPPDYVLGRVIDPTVYPGYTYRYRLRVKMANPNKDLTNVLSPAYAKDAELKSDWYEVPKEIVVPPETYFYAVDQKELDPKDYKGHYPPVRDDKRQVLFQLHKWLYSVPLPTDAEHPAEVGEWVIAERVPVSRGEYVGRMQYAQVPVWRSNQEAFVLLTNPKDTAPTSQTKTFVPVDFSQPDGSDLVLVDYTTEAKHERGGGKPAVTQPAAAEVLVLSPDGKLLAHDSVADAKDETRAKRLEAYRNRIKDVKSGKANDKSGPSSADPANPFGGKGGPPQ